MLFYNSGPNAGDGMRPAEVGYYYAGRGGVGYIAGGGGGGLDRIIGTLRWGGGFGAPGFVYVEWG